MSEVFEKIPENLIRAFLTNRMCLFIGAGVSQNLGMPNWAGLAKKIINLCRKHQLINFLKEETLIKMGSDPIITISYCHNLILKSNKSLIKKDYNELLIDIFYQKKPFQSYTKKETERLKQGIALYELILELAKNALIVTTNYDNIIPINDIKRTSYDSCNFKKIPQEKGIIYLHGKINKQDSENYNKLILTREQYDNLYLNNPKEHLKCLNKIFQNKYILFLGYSLGDFEILQSLSMVNNNNDKETEALKSYFLLVDYRDYEKESFDIKRDYYRDTYNIETFVYNVSINGYIELFNKLNELKEKIPNEIDCFSYIDKYLEYKNLKTIHDKVLFQDLMEKEKFKEYFLQNMNDIDYFDYFNSKGFFSYKFNAKEAFYKPMWMLEKLIPKIIVLTPQEQDYYFEKYIQIIKNNLALPFPSEDMNSLHSIWRLIIRIPIKYYDVNLIKLLRNYPYEWYLGQMLKNLIKEDNSDLKVASELVELWLQFDIKTEKNWYFKKNEKKIVPKNKNMFNDITPLDISKLIKNNYTFVVKDFELILTQGMDRNLLNRKKTIKDSKYNQSYYEDEFEIYLLNILRNCLTVDDNCLNIVEEFLFSKYITLNRLAIYIIHQKWMNVEFQELFYKYFNSLLHKQNEYFRLRLHFIRFELDDLLTVNAQEIILSNKFKLDKFLDKIYRAEKDDYKDQTICEFLKPFKNIEPYKSKYLDLTKKLNYEPNIEPLVSKSGWVEQKSPISYDEFKALTLEQQRGFLNKPIAEKREYYINENDEDGHFISISEEGLANQFKELIIQDYQKYIDNIDTFIDIPIIYKESIIEALIEVAGQKQNAFTAWEKVLQYIQKINKTFELINGDWLLKRECKFINIMTSRTKDNLLFNQAFDIIATILKYPLFEKVTIERALELNFINIIGGVAAETLFLIVQNKPTLEDSLIELIIEQLNKKDLFEFQEALGAYFNNLYYAFKKQNKQKLFFEILESIKNKTDEEQTMFSSGYLFYNRQYIKNIFSRFEKSNLFENVLDNKLLDDDKKQQFVDLAIYASFFENKDYLLNRILESDNSFYLKNVITVLCRRKDLSPYKQRILAIWDNLKVFNKNKNDLTEEDNKLIGKTFNLLKYLDDSDITNKNILNKLFISFNYQSEHNQYFMFEKIGEKIHNSPALLNLVLGGYINSQNSIDSYPEKEVIKLIEEVYAWNKEEAIKIADICINEKNALNDILKWRRSIKPKEINN